MSVGIYIFLPIQSNSLDYTQGRKSLHLLDTFVLFSRRRHIYFPIIESIKKLSIPSAQKHVEPQGASQFHIWIPFPSLSTEGAWEGFVCDKPVHFNRS